MSICVTKIGHSCGSSDGDNMIGEKFNRLLVLSENPVRNKDRRIMYDCLCDCGVEVTVAGKHLRLGTTKSCGCYSRDATIAMNKTGKTKLVDGVPTRRHPLFKRWQAMLQRCYNENHTYYHHYGGRGIQVCERWRNSFSDFVEDIAYIPDGLTLDRIDNNGHYSPDNIKLSTMKEQCQNRRPNSGWRKKRCQAPV